MSVCVFFQAEDGIRDLTVTGVQTCALPIYYLGPDKGGEKAYRLLAEAMAKSDRVALAKFVMRGKETLVLIRAAQGGLMQIGRASVGKECRSRWSPYH